MDHFEARANCETKKLVNGSGRLFEPKSHEISEMVAEKANEIFDSENYYHIGVNDIAKPDTYVYDSTSLTITFTPKWDERKEYRPGNNEPERKCILVGHSKQELGKWIDEECRFAVQSVFEV